MRGDTRYGGGYLYFDPRPKVRRADLFDREEELKRFAVAMKISPLIVVAGPRRTGKTSFINVALRENDTPYMFLDLRELPFNPSRAELVRRLDDGVNKIPGRWRESIFSQLKQLKGIEIMGNSISLAWKKDGVSFAEVFDKLDGWAEKNKTRFIAAFDEIQAVRGDKDLVRLFAHIADFDRNVNLVMTGSEVGLLFSFLGFDDPDSPLFGRHVTKIVMSSLSPEYSRRFLISGFKQSKLKCPDETLLYAIEKMGGIIGWLTQYGAKCSEEGICSRELVDEVVRDGGRLARSEVVRLNEWSPRYSAILNRLAVTPGASWGSIKGELETREGRALTNHAVTSLLEKLENLSFVVKTDGGYAIADPILREGIMAEKLPD